MSLDIATRVYNHGFRIDPIVRTLLDTDFYKFLMLQLIRARSPDMKSRELPSSLGRLFMWYGISRSTPFTPRRASFRAKYGN